MGGGEGLSGDLTGERISGERPMREKEQQM